jgi:hypothetical protein
MSSGFSPAILIPLVAIGMSLAIPIVAIVMDFKRRRLQFEERRAMIEKGMVPPALDESLGAARGIWPPNGRAACALASSC